MDSFTGRPVSHERWRLGAQWAGILTGPVAFLMLLEAQYVFGYVACEWGQTWFLHAAAIVSALVVAGAGVLAWRAAGHNPVLSQHPAAPDSHSLANTDEVRRQRSAWMSVLAAGMSALFLVMILALELPLLLLEPCQ
jgi:hypothetical protein